MDVIPMDSEMWFREVDDELWRITLQRDGSVDQIFCRTIWIIESKQIIKTVQPWVDGSRDEGTYDFICKEDAIFVFDETYNADDLEENIQDLLIVAGILPDQLFLKVTSDAGIVETVPLYSEKSGCQ